MRPKFIGLSIGSILALGAGAGLELAHPVLAQVLLPLLGAGSLINTGPPVFIQSTPCSSGISATATLVCPQTGNITVTSGNTLVAWMGSNASTGFLTPNQGTGTATIGPPTMQGTCPSASTPVSCIWTANITGTGTINFNLRGMNSTSVANWGAIVEVSAGHTVIAMSPYASTPVAACTSCTGASLTTTGANRMVLTFLATCCSATTTISAPSPFAFDFNNSPFASGLPTASGHFFQVTAGTYTPTWTSSASQAYVQGSIALGP